MTDRLSAESSRLPSRPLLVEWRGAVSFYLPSGCTNRGSMMDPFERAITDTLLFGKALIDIFRFHLKRKLRVEIELLPSSKFIDRRLKVARMAHVKGPILSNIPVIYNRRRTLVI